MGTVLDSQQEEICATARWDFCDLSAIFVNCTLKRSPELSNTRAWPTTRSRSSSASASRSTWSARSTMTSPPASTRT